MLPPIPPQTLSTNPLFSALYTDLTTTHLNPDASTRHPPSLSTTSTTTTSSSQTPDLDHPLRTYRAELAKQHLLQNSLRHTTLRSRQLPDDLSEVLDLLTNPSAASSCSDSAGVAEAVNAFHENIQAIAREISIYLDRSARDLVSLVQPEGLDPRAGAEIDHLPANAARLRTQIFSRHRELVAQRGATSKLILEIVGRYSSLSLLSLSHAAGGGASAGGSMRKGVLAKATYLSLLAESMRGKVGVVRFDALGEVYDEEAVGALENYRVHLTDTNLRLVARKRVVEGELERYNAAGADMRGLVERYAALLRGVESVVRDIKRLGGTV